MDRSYSIRRNKDFQYVYRRGRKYSDRLLTLVYLRGNRVQVGFSVGRKVGDSVRRNKLKRRLREAFRSYLPALKPGRYIFGARIGSAQSDYWTLRKTMYRLMEKAGALSEAPQGNNEKTAFMDDKRV